MARVPLAWRNLTVNWRRLLVSIAGVMFAVILMFMQLGYKNALLDSNLELIRQLNGDLILTSAARHRMGDFVDFPRRRIYQSLSHPSVATAFPLYINLTGSWRNPHEGNRTTIRVIGVRAEDSVFLNPRIDALRERLRVPDTALFDQKSRHPYGRADAGTHTELSNREIEVIGTFSLGPDFLTDGNLVVSDHTFSKLFANADASRPALTSVSLGLLNLTRHANVLEVRKTLALRLPPDVVVLTKSEMIDLERNYWDRQSMVGPIFNMGVFIGFVVGLVICYQILFTDLSDQLPQFATLKAIGYDNTFLKRVVLHQSVLLSVLSFLPAVACTCLLYALLTDMTGLVMRMSLTLALMMLVLTVLMCVLAGRLAVRKVLSLDPSELF